MARYQFKKLEYLYLIALGCIALSIVISQLLIQTSISRQQDDARVINVAGRQRMLSQKISKLALKIGQQKSDLQGVKQDLSSALGLWKRSHDGLLLGDSSLGLSGENSPKVKSMFAEIESNFREIYKSGNAILEAGSGEDISAFINAILDNERIFLEGMDAIVFQYDREARSKVDQLRKTEIYLFIISILIIILELLFVFRPLARNVRKTVVDLQESEMSSKKMTQELSKLYEELGKSYQDLEAVNVTPETPSVYATLNMKGVFQHFSAKFLTMMEYEDMAPPTNLAELLKQADYRNDFIQGLMDMLKTGHNWSGELRLVTEPGDFCWLETYIVSVAATEEIKVVARNITEFKEAKIRSRELNRERIEKSVKQQHYRSALILEGQEEERKRLSRELHDGVGQMLSAMNLLLQSLTPGSKPMQMRLDDAKGLMKSIIREVRRVSFNLTPSSLDDFGLVPAVKKFCDEINSVTKTNVEFVNETRFINRLEGNIETNLYRIIQEAVNNALKYARASNITVSFSHTINALNIFIKDDGKGFDYVDIHQSGHFEKAGHGIFNMKERTSYIGGSFEITTQPGAGTQIFITLSLDKND
ncbi:MAG: type IV pili methyl-accepting chemotaxis transducer N-terminal domain-containing protein [Cyclobacteriaceae bacterium]